MKSKRPNHLFLVTFALLAGFNSYAQKNLADSIITKELLQHYVQTLAHDSMQGRYTGTEGCEKAADWIALEMNSIGLQPLNSSDTGYHLFYKIEDGNKLITTANIVGFIPGKVSNSYIIFSAHYDHVGDASQQVLMTQFKPAKKDKIYNGANDNASGVAAMLAIAKYFKLLQNNNSSIIFIAFSGEEMGLLGSNAFVNSFVHPKNIKQVVNLEMLGRQSDINGKPFVTEGINSFGFTRKLNNNLQKTDATVKKKFFRPDGLPEENYFGRSDNYSFALKAVPANTIMSSTGLDIYYHSPADEWQTLDYKKMAIIVKNIALACTPLVQDINN